MGATCRARIANPSGAHEFRSGPESDGKFQERIGVGLLGERRQAIKTEKHKYKKISWCQNKPLYLLLCIACIASKPKIQLFP